MKKTALVFVLLALFLSPQVSGATEMYTSRADWVAAVGTYRPVDEGQIVEYASLTKLTLPRGQTATFSPALDGRIVGSSWGTWSNLNTPRVLWTTLTITSVTGTFSGGISAFGLEMEPNEFNVFSMTLATDDGGTLTQSVDGNGGAAFFGWAGGSVTSMTLSSTVDFAFGRMVQPVPLPAGILLLAPGLGALAMVRRKLNRQA